VLPRIMSHEQEDWEIPRLDLAPLDVQGPMLRRMRRRRPEPYSPIAPIEDFPTSSNQDNKGGPFAVFDLLDL